MLLFSGCDDHDVPLLKQGQVFPRDTLSEMLRDSGIAVDLQGKTLVVNFWATWCVPCRREMPDLQRLSDALDNQRFVVIGVSVDEDRNLMQEFLLQQGVRFPVVNDYGQSLARTTLGIRAFPQTFVVATNGRVARSFQGERAWNDLAMHRLLQAVHAGVATGLE